MAGGYPLLPSVVQGETADVYFRRTLDVLRSIGRDPVVTMAVFSGSRPGRFAGLQQLIQLLAEVGFGGDIRAVPEGVRFEPGETVLTLCGHYSQFGLYETAMLGILSSSSGWGTAAAECVEAAGTIPVVSFGARHTHPNVASIMDAVAVEAGCTSCSTPLGAQLSDVVVSGTMPHAFVLIMGDTVRAAKAFDANMTSDVPRIVLVDTLQDEAVESLRVADALRDRLAGVRLDTPSERGGVTVELAREVRARLDLAGFNHVTIFVSGGFTPDRIRRFVDASTPVDGFGVGSYIASASPIQFTADIREIEGKPVSKRGRLPGTGDVTRLRPISRPPQET